MLRAVLVDDEKHALNLLSKAISERDDMQVIGAYCDVSEMLDVVKELRPDVVFLDIEMPELNGLQLGERLRKMELELEIVFVTAYRQYALEAFEVNAIDYLLKPIDPDMLGRSVERVKKRKLRQAEAAQYKNKAVTDGRIECFGGFAVYKAGQAEPISFPTAKSEELLAYLLMNRNMNISKWTLCDNLWPELESSRNSDKNLHTTVYRMKKVMRDNGIDVRLFSKRGYYRMEYDIPCDYIQFGQEADRVEQDNSIDISKFLEIMQLYKGALFADRDYHWCEAERERMSRYYTVVAKKLATSYIGNAQNNKAINVLLTMLDRVPYDGEAYEMLLKLFIAMQDKASFVMYYEKMEHVFRRELGLEPPDELKKLYKSM